MKKKQKIYCPYCGAEAKLRPASVVYKENTIDETAYLFVCDRYPKCDSYVNAHRDSKKPMGTLANSELRNRRILAHHALAKLWENGVMTGEYTDVSHLWQKDFVYFLIGCSFSFESELMAAGVPVRHIEEGKNVPMYLTNIDSDEAGVFHGKLVVSMRPMLPEQAIRAVSVTASMPRVHGTPIHIGDPAEIGIKDIAKPNFGDAVTMKEGEIPVFWCCGVTPQSVVMSAKPPIAISHAPGHMFITDVKNTLLKD